jgi:hypothetical protein
VRLYDRIKRDGLIVSRFPNDPTPHRVKWDHLPGVNVRVEIDEPMKAYWGAETDEVYTLDDFGVVRPPYQAMWMEGAMPARSFADSEWKNTVGHERGFIVWDDENAVTMLMVVWAPKETLAPVLIPLSSSYMYGEDGTLERGDGAQWMRGHDSGSDRSWRDWCERCERYDGGNPFDGDNYLVLYALSLMNCKNVKVQDVTRNPKVAKAHKKRHGVPMSRFSRIVLPNQRNGTGNGHGGGGAAAKHLVRGHFKTYTTDAPLMGRHVGTYWWGWHARGDSALGNITPEYHVADPTERTAS